MYVDVGGGVQAYIPIDTPSVDMTETTGQASESQHTDGMGVIGALSFLVIIVVVLYTMMKASS